MPLSVAWTLAAVGIAAVVAVVALLAVSLCVTCFGRGGDEPSAALYARIAQFYDATSGLWERVWGEHMHHGFYPVDGDAASAARPASHQQAQIDMIEQLLRWAGISGADDLRAAGAAPGGDVRRRGDGKGAAIHVLDAGCGVGGSARHLARAFGDSVRVTGVTLSERQAESATRRTRDAGLQDRVSFRVANAMKLPFDDATFDAVWSMESGEHMPDKDAFVAEVARVLKPGGKFLMATWCHRAVEGDASRGPLNSSEKRHLGLLCRNYCLPRWVPTETYVTAAGRAGLSGVRTGDWTQHILPFWPAVIRSALLPSSLLGLLRAGWLAVRGALTAVLMLTGFRRKLLVFAVFTAHKPA